VTETETETQSKTVSALGAESGLKGRGRAPPLCIAPIAPHVTEIETEEEEEGLKTRMCAAAERDRVVGHVYVCERAAESAPSTDMPHNGLSAKVATSEPESALGSAVASAVPASAVAVESELVASSAVPSAEAASEWIRKIRISTRKRTESERASSEHRMRSVTTSLDGEGARERDREGKREGNGSTMPLPPIAEMDTAVGQDDQEKSGGEVEFPRLLGGVADSSHSPSPSPFPCPRPPPVSLSAAKERFLRGSRGCAMRCVLSAAVGLSRGSKVGSLSVCPSTVRPSMGEGDDQVQDLLLVTAVEAAVRDASEGYGHGYGIAEGRERGAEVVSLSHVLLLDSSLRTLAVLRNDCSGSEREGESCVSASAVDIPVSDPPLDLGSEDISGAITAAMDAKLKGEGAAVTVMGAGGGTRLRKGSTPAQPAPVIVTGACLVPHPYPYRRSPHSFSCSVALATAHSSDSSRQLSNKLLLWHPQWHPHTAVDLNAIGSSAQWNDSCLHDCISSLAADGSDLPFNNTPPLSTSKRAAEGSRGHHVLLAARGTGLRQHMVLGDPNGHVWGATLGPESDFPGPMYPPGFTLMQRVKSYLECEDELDYPVHAAPPGTATGTSTGSAAGTESGPVLQLDPLERVPVLIPSINVGVCPLYHSSSSGASRAPRYTSLSLSRWGCDENAHKQSQEQVREVSFRLSQRLPMRLVGDVRARFLEQKTRALMLRKASMARARSSTVALKKKIPSSSSSSSSHRTAWKKKKRPNKGSAAARAGRAGDGCSVSDAGSSLPQDSHSLGAVQQQQEEEEEIARLLVTTIASSLTPVPLEGGEMEGEGDMYIEDGDAEHTDLSSRHGRGTKRRRPESAEGRDRDSEDSSQSENEGEENEGGPDPDPALVLTNGEGEEGEGADGAAKANSTLSLCDVLPVPRRVLTGDFALRVLKRKEVSLCSALHCTLLHCTALYFTALHCTALYCTLLHCTATLSGVDCAVLSCTCHGISTMRLS
jgi:hypothetical protein